MFKKLLITLAVLFLSVVVTYKNKIVSPIPDIPENQQEKVLSESNSAYKEQLENTLKDFSLKFTLVAQTSTKYREEDFNNDNFLILIKDLHETSKETQVKIMALRTPPEELEEGVKTFLEGLNKLLNVTQTIIDYSEGKVPYTKISESESVFFDAMYDFDSAEEMLGIEIERGQI